MHRIPTAISGFQPDVSRSLFQWTHVMFPNGSLILQMGHSYISNGLLATVVCKKNQQQQNTLQIFHGKGKPGLNIQAGILMLMIPHGYYKTTCTRDQRPSGGTHCLSWTAPNRFKPSMSISVHFNCHKCLCRIHVIKSQSCLTLCPGPLQVAPEWKEHQNGISVTPWCC